MYKQLFNPLSGNFDLVKDSSDEPVELSYTIANNQTNALLGFTFSHLTREYFSLTYAVFRSVDGTELVETGQLRAVYRSETSTWFMSNDYTGPGAEVTFSINSSGELLYTSSDLSGANYSGILKLFVDKQLATAGEVNTASNLGAGEGVFATKLNSDLQFKSLVAGANIALSSDSNSITIDASAAGEANTASNLGAGKGLFSSKLAQDLQFKSLVAGTSISLSSDTDTVTINGTGEANTASNLGAGEGLFSSKISEDLQFKSLVAGTNVSLSSDADTVTVNTSGEANTASNVGSSGFGLYLAKVGENLQFKKIIAGSNISITSQADTITINSTGGGMNIYTTKRYFSGYSYTIPSGMYALVSYSTLDLTTTTVTAGTVLSRGNNTTNHLLDGQSKANQGYVYITVIRN